MFSKIAEAERKLNGLLPVRRLEQSPPTDLMSAAVTWSNEVWAKAEELGIEPLSAKQLTQGHLLANHPVYICGVHRSGTTLVRDLLDGHPDLVVLPSEGTFYANLEFKLLSLPENERTSFLCREWLRRLANPINQPPYWLLGRSNEEGSPYVSFARYFMAWWENCDKGNPQWPHIAIVLAYASYTNNLAAKLWVDKTPANERFLDRIRKEMPEAKIIQVIRDPVAILSSRKKMEPSITLRRALLDLKMSFRVADEQREKNAPEFLLLRYEEICEVPQTVIERIALFLNIEAPAILKQPTVAGLPSQANSSFNKEAASGQILKREQHLQPEILSKEEQALIAIYIGDISARLNYPLTQVGFLRKLYLRLKYRLW
ncbi:MAG: sulfotransferase family protein [Mucilaginibacter sp.]